MAPTIPADPVAPGALRDVFTSCLAAVQGRRNVLGLAPMRHAAVVLVDGLGAEALAARAGHARTLAAQLSKCTRRPSGFPTTTASALATLTTGVDPGTHGIVGYSALDPSAGAIVNQLHGFDDGTLPLDWQRAATVFERARDAGIRAVAIGPRHNAGSGFTRAVLRGAEYLGARSIEERFAVLDTVFESADPAIAYLYVPELDQTAHTYGWQSPRWTAHLETVDAAVAASVGHLAAGDGLLLTADHGILDVPPDRHIDYDRVPGLLDGVQLVGGEPRCLQLYLAPDASGELVADRWRDAMGSAATVMTRGAAVDANWFGDVDSEVLPRIGDILIAATGRWVLLDSRNPKTAAMIGHHGSWTSAERIVPLLRFGAAAG